MRNPNSQECSYFGRKLSCVSCDDIEVSKGYVCIGSERDDEIYYDIKTIEPKENMVKERITITAIYEPEIGEDEGHCVDIDLEDILRFAAKHCQEIYERVLGEAKA